MKTINLRDYYPFYEQDCVIEVPDNVYSELRKSKLREEAYIRRKYRYKAFYSLDYGDDIERNALFAVITPHETLVCKMDKERLYTAISSLTEKQAKRVYAHFFLGMSKAEIARVEGVTEACVGQAINRAIQNIEKIFKNNFQKGI